MMRISIFIFLILASISNFAQTNSQNAAIQLHATVSSNPANITIKWMIHPGTSSFTIYRKVAGAGGWGDIHASLGGGSTEYIDNSVTQGQLYEYKVVRSSSSGNGYGYLNSGVKVPATEQRGKMILLVADNNLPVLEPQIQILTDDLRGDGWNVIRHNISTSASVTSIKSIIVSDYNSDPTNIKAVFLLGNIPVPYSGNINPDGHSSHLGAWPADVFYGDVNGNWTDNNFYTNTAQRSANNNVPDDGKFDQSDLPSNVELQVGRVDLSDMPAFSSGEAQLLIDYLNKAHDYKRSIIDPLIRAVIFDNFQWLADPLASSAWRNFGQLVDPANITAPYQYGAAFSTYVNSQSYLWTYACGGGLQLYTEGELTYNGADNVGNTQDYASIEFDGIFNMSFGSYFGDWDNKNNFLRAPLASGNALTNCWAAIPNYYFHHMGMGHNIGYSIIQTQNNTTTYTPHNGGWQGSIGRTHVALMGDPSLRMHMINPPTGLTVIDGGGYPTFSWTASTEPNVLGYYVYEVDTANGMITRITPNVVNGTVFSDALVSIKPVKYMVRAVKLQTSHSGSYFDLSLGDLAIMNGGVPALDCNGVLNGPDMPGTPCNDGDPNTGMDQWDGNCNCIGLVYDCAGMPGGTAVNDDCGVCDGDNSSCAGCDGVPNSGLFVDACGICDGDNSTCTDCLGVVNGTAVVDQCGVCNGDGSSCNLVSVCFDLATDGDNDVEEIEAGNIYSDQALLDLASDPSDGGWRGDQYIGMRFGAIDIPQGTTISEAYVQFTSGNNVNVNPSSMVVFAHDVDDAPQIGWDQYELSGRTQTTAQEAWDPAPWNTIGVSGVDQRTPNIQNVIQEIVDRAGWVANNDILVMVSGTGTRCARTSNGAPNDAAQLCITYSTPAVADCEGVVGGPAIPGSACDDGDTNTGNDAYDSNCNCSGQAIDCAGVAGGTSVPGTSCNDGDANTGNDVYDNNCNCAGQALDCQSTPGGSAVPGAACDDGDLNTGNDIYNNSCICSGQLIDCAGISGGSALPGASCNDGNPNTGNDIYDNSCNCVGQLIDCLGVAGGSALPDAACDDGDPNTGNDIFDGSCNCAGQALDCAGVPGGSAQSGSSCNDGDPNTGNDIYDNNCNCSGLLIDCQGVSGGSALPGGTCDDGDASTGNDTWNNNCNCVGLSFDCEGVAGGTLVPGSSCNDGDINTGNDVYDNNCNCFGQLIDCMGVAGGTSLPGTPCDDGDVNTANDVWDLNCNCGGSFVDCLGVPGGTALPGTACDDGDPRTGNDIYNSNCTCTGQTFDCLGVAGGSDLSGSPCNDGDPNTGNDVYNTNCNCVGQLIDCLGVAGGSSIPGAPCDDGDPNTGSDVFNSNCTCAGLLYDCLSVVGGSALPGTACDDGDPNTANDVYDSNCNCAGSFVDCEGTAGGSALPGTSCNDNDPNTGNDVYDNNCNCSGQLIDCLGVIGGNALPGSACNDGDPNTGNDIYDSNCNCAGLAYDCLSVPGGTAVAGTTCDDGDINTGNDVFDVNCNCSGQLIDCLGVPGGTALQGTPCNDGDPNTGNDVYGNNCNCSGQIIDCMGVAGGPSMPGTPCNDGDPNTSNDVWNLNCNCGGSFADCMGVPGGNALPGLPCDDGDATTGNDLWDSNCNCSGDVIDCLGIIGGNALPGNPCNDGDPNTNNDTYDNDCNCTGVSIDCAGVTGGTAVFDSCGICAGGNTGVLPDTDLDSDGVLDCNDNCPSLFNPSQLDLNNNGIGDECEFLNSIDEIEEEIFSIYPNPVRDELNIKFTGDAEMILIHNMLGGLINRIEFAPRMDLGELQRGTYLISVADENGIPIRTERLIKH